jgi:hypothetical protein
LDSDIPESQFPTTGAIASPGVLIEIDAGFEFDCAAETASVVGFDWHGEDRSLMDLMGDWFDGLD